MKKFAGMIICWWYSHDLDKVESICASWKPGFIFTRIKFESMAFVLSCIGLIKGMDPCSNEFISWALNCEKEEC